MTNLFLTFQAFFLAKPAYLTFVFAILQVSNRLLANRTVAKAVFERVIRV